MKIVLCGESVPELYGIVSKIPDVEFIAISVSDDSLKNVILDKDPSALVYTNDEIVNWNISWVSHNDITKYYQTQLKSERYYSRFTTGLSSIQSYYYSSLAFWLNVFQNNVDCVLVGGVEHGRPIDSLPLDIAKNNSIPVFTFEAVFP